MQDQGDKMDSAIKEMRDRYPIRYLIFLCYIIILLCILCYELFFNTEQGIWLIGILTVLVALLCMVPLEHMVGYVMRAPQRYRLRHRANLHEEEHPYGHGYQAVSSSSNTTRQAPVTVQDLAAPYEAPQAEYPQQQAPMMNFK